MIYKIRVYGDYAIVKSNYPMLNLEKEEMTRIVKEQYRQVTMVFFRNNVNYAEKAV